MTVILKSDLMLNIDHLVETHNEIVIDFNNIENFPIAQDKKKILAFISEKNDFAGFHLQQLQNLVISCNFEDLTELIKLAHSLEVIFTNYRAILDKIIFFDTWKTVHSASMFPNFEDSA